MSRNLSKSHGLQNRIKRIMQSDDDVGKVAAASTHLVAIALEEFLDELVKGAAAVSVERGSKLLSPAHVKAHVMKEPTLDFCKDIVARAPDLGDVEETQTEKKSRKRNSTSKAGDAKKQPKLKVEEKEEEIKEEKIDTSFVLEGLEDVPTVADDALADGEDNGETAEAELENYDDF